MIFVTKQKHEGEVGSRMSNVSTKILEALLKNEPVEEVFSSGTRKCHASALRHRA